MDLKRLEVFCRTVELKSFTRAAKQLNLSQPTVSEHIRHLEQLLDEKLLDRFGREVVPTPAGCILYDNALKMLRLKSETLTAIEAFRGRMGGSLALGASTIPGAYLLPRIIGSIKKEHPGIHFTLRISGSNKIVREIIEGNLEIGIVGSKPRDGRLTTEALFADEILLVVSPEHPFASRQQVEVSELISQDFILREPDSGTRAVALEGLRAHGFDLEQARVVAELGSGEAIRQSIKAGLGCAFMSALAVAEDVERGSLATLRVAGVNLKRQFHLLTRRGRRLSPPAQLFLECLRAQIS